MDLNKLKEAKQSFEKIYFAPKVTGKTIKKCCINTGLKKYFFRLLSYLNTLCLNQKWLNEKNVEKMMTPDHYDDRLSRIDAIFNEQLMIEKKGIDSKEKKIVEECKQIHAFLSVHLNNIHRNEDRKKFDFILSMSTRGYLAGRLLFSLSPKAIEHFINLNLNGVTLKKIFNHLKIPYTTYVDARGREKLDLLSADNKEERNKRDQEFNTLVKFLEDKSFTDTLILD